MLMIMRITLKTEALSMGAKTSIHAKENVHVIFQPHLYPRTRDFADGFADVLDMQMKCGCARLPPPQGHYR